MNLRPDRIAKDMEKALLDGILKKVQHDLEPHLRHLEARMNQERGGYLEINIDSRQRVTVKPKRYSPDLTSEIEAVLSSL